MGIANFETEGYLKWLDDFEKQSQVQQVVEEEEEALETHLLRLEIRNEKI